MLLDFTCFAFMLVSSLDCCFIPWKRRSFERQSGWPRFLACRLLVSDLQGVAFAAQKIFWLGLSLLEDVGSSGLLIHCGPDR